MKKNNSVLLGIISSLVVTAFGIALIYVLKYMPLNYSFSEYITDLIHGASKSSATLSLCLLANIPLMYYNQQRKRIKTFYGISIIIGIMAIIIIGKKFGFF
jgi:ABC-type Fe3+ transport system permease subunit